MSNKICSNLEIKINISSAKVMIFFYISHGFGLFVFFPYFCRKITVLSKKL